MYWRFKTLADEEYHEESTIRPRSKSEMEIGMVAGTGGVAA
ncbi:hypothetical protein T09_5716 [Trichinella sp. T9]|nr:hypothetical protein T09_5716 [Trichinella sp. T9]